MQKQEKQNIFNSLCDQVILILYGCDAFSRLPITLLRIFHPYGRDLHRIKNKIEELLKSSDKKSKGEHEESEGAKLKKEKKKINSLINLLDQERYFITIHTHNRRLRDKIQDAMLAVLFLLKRGQLDLVLSQKSQQVKFDANQSGQSAALNRYKNHYKKQRAIYGRYVNRLSKKDIILASKGGMINGEMSEHFGTKWMVEHGLHYIRDELLALQKKKVEKGFLRFDAIKGYIKKLDFLLSSENELQRDEGALVQNSRYLLENITNSAGVAEGGRAQYQAHRTLVRGCYWVDEMFKVVKGQFDVASMTE